MRRGDVVAAVAQRTRDRALVHGVEIGMQQADGDRLHSLGQRRHAAVPRLDLAAQRVEAPVHLEPQLARHERCGPVGERVVQRRSSLPGDLDHIGEALRRDERDARTSPFEQRVGRHGGAVREQ